ncbi:MAG: hypothetical protein ISR65_15195 [Bacteriovoracaceae bacterium]|nr:hypothetical protein [Bacteriovoracaceae bacterium]
MAILYCESCNIKKKVKDEYIGKRTKCPECSAVVKITASSSVSNDKQGTSKKSDSGSKESKNEVKKPSLRRPTTLKIGANSSRKTIASKSMNKDQPNNLKGLCWGGFFLTFIWGIFNKTWISLLGLVPGLNILISIVLLFRGREWAWKNGTWKDAAHFNRVQKNWSIAGFLFAIVGFFGGIMLLGVISALLIPNLKKVQSKSKTSEAKIGLASIYVAQMQNHAEEGTYSSDLINIGFEPTGMKFYKFGFTDTSALFKRFCSDCFANKERFKAVAIGNIDSDPTIDVWTIDDRKSLIHVVNDLKE